LDHRFISATLIFAPSSSVSLRATVSPSPTLFSVLFARGVHARNRTCIRLHRKYMRAKQTRARKMYDCSRQDGNIKIRGDPDQRVESGNNTPLVSTRGAPSFARVWWLVRKTRADQTKRSHNRRLLPRSLCCMKISFKHIAAAQHAIKPRPFFSRLLADTSL